MPEYRRMHAPGGTFFLTVVTYRRIPLFSDADNVSLLREAVKCVKDEHPFEILGAVILPEHLHFLWELPPDDTDYSSRIGRMKVLFTRALQTCVPVSVPLPASRRRHRDAAVWQRRFWEHTIRDDRDLERHMDYIHYNPVKHDVAACPHAWPWPYSSFHRWVRQGAYEKNWCCLCNDRTASPPLFDDIAGTVGE